MRSQIRKRSGLTLQKLSKLCNISVSRLSCYERNEISLPPRDLAVLTAILKLQLDQTPIFNSSEQLAQFLKSGAN
jgi:transcriptional regulator with XRE-family HTH domain